MTSRSLAVPLLAAALTLVFADRAAAQDSRAEIVREQQAARQGVLAPPRANRAEVLIDRLEDWGLFTGQPVGADLWVALAWLVGILVVAYGFAMLAYRRKIS